MSVRVRASGMAAPGARERWGRLIGTACRRMGGDLYAESVTVGDGLAVALARQGAQKWLMVAEESGRDAAGFCGTPCPSEVSGVAARVQLCPLTPENAAQLRATFPYFAPRVPGTALSIGLGDRLGVATPGHVRVVRGWEIDPVLAQQSIRELVRTQREPGEVIDNATWGVLQAGWHDGYAADADHLTSVRDIDRTATVGFSFFTIDPGAHVDVAADRLSAGELRVRSANIPWAALETTPEDCRRRYADRTVEMGGGDGGVRVRLAADDVLRILVKYGRAIAHTAGLYRHLLARRERATFWFEVSVDETDSPTSAAEHLCWALELQRLGVQWESLAPRLVGTFYKGVDYTGDLSQFRTEFRKHARIAEHFGTYKLSLHSGSDKFAIYPIVAELTGGRLHVKTSGTSYLEALRVVAQAVPDLFREILAAAKERYAEDCDDYHVGGDVRAVPDPYALADADLPGVLDQPDTRQVCHVTFGSILTLRDDGGAYRFRERLLAVLDANEEAYYRRLEAHFARHIQPFV